MNAAALSDEEVAVCAAMVETAEAHAAEAERMAKSIDALRKHDMANHLLALVLNLHAAETARCKALGVTPSTLEQTLDRYGVISEESFAWAIANTQEDRH